MKRSARTPGTKIGVLAPQSMPMTPRRFLLAIALALLSVTRTDAIESLSVTGEAGAGSARAHAAMTAVHTRLLAVDGRYVSTLAGEFQLAPDVAVFVSRGGELTPVSDLRPYLGAPLDLRVRDGQAVRLVVENTGGHQ
jgi:hypothetical protein